MARTSTRKKKKKAEGGKEDTWALFNLVGGPRDGETLRLAPKPLQFLRLAFPEWCTYEFHAETGDYHHIGDQRVTVNEGDFTWKVCEHGTHPHPA